MHALVSASLRYMAHVKPKTFREQRLLRGWTLEELAQRCSDAGAPVHYTTLYRIEQGAMPRPKLLGVLARLLDLDVSDFEREVG